MTTEQLMMVNDASPKAGWNACAVVRRLFFKEQQPSCGDWDAPPGHRLCRRPGAVEEHPARSDVRVMAAPRGLIRAFMSRPIIGVKRGER